MASLGVFAFHSSGASWINGRVTVVYRAFSALRNILVMYILLCDHVEAARWKKLW